MLAIVRWLHSQDCPIHIMIGIVYTQEYVHVLTCACLLSHREGLGDTEKPQSL